MDPSIEWDMSHFGGWLEDQVYYGHDGVRRFLYDWLAVWERYEAGVEEVTELRPGIVFTGSWQRGYGSDSHVPVEQLHVGQIATVRNGLVVRFEIWSDRDAARAEALRR